MTVAKILGDQKSGVAKPFALESGRQSVNETKAALTKKVAQLKRRMDSFKPKPKKSVGKKALASDTGRSTKISDRASNASRDEDVTIPMGDFPSEPGVAACIVRIYSCRGACRCLRKPPRLRERGRV